MAEASARSAGGPRALGGLATSRGAQSRSSSPMRARASSPQRARGRGECAVSASRMTPTPAQRPFSQGRSAASATELSFAASNTEAALPTLRRPRAPRRPSYAPIAASMKFPETLAEDKSVVAPAGPKVPPQSKSAGSSASAKQGEAASSIDRIEAQAKQSLDKLKHLLYKLKTRREGEVTSSLLATPSFSDGDPTLVEDEQQIFVSQKIEVNLSTPPPDGVINDASDEVASDLELLEKSVMGRVVPVPEALDLKSLQTGLEFQLDALTCTRAIVTFDDLRKTAVVTVTATVRAAELEDQGSYSEKAIAMAARALARTCLDLDDKAQAAALNASLSSTSATSAFADIAQEKAGSAATTVCHQRVQRCLLTGSVVSHELAPPEFGSTPFRPVFSVKLQTIDGSIVEALFKPCVPGDRTLRWKRAQDDWVAYQLASLLGIDVVPPAVIRSGVTLGARKFDLGVMILKPSHLLRLESTDPSLCAKPEAPQAIISDIRILDALLGNALRPNDGFLASSIHWADGATPTAAQRKSFHPLVLGQPMGPHLGCALHTMWTAESRNALLRGVPVITKSTLLRLKGLCHSVLLDVFGGILSADEIETILAKRDHLIAYFDSLSRKLGSVKVCV